MGFYIHRGREGSLSILEDLVTRAVYQAIVPTGYGGSKNENWYIRLLPPPIPGSTEHVVSTTPYVVVSPTSRIGWRIFSRRCLPRRASTVTSAT
jgi:hypothetical protein